ncbi:YadA-like family protein [Escherichia coli]|nr:YadA-like family protein [Escherichia coli]EIG9980881.1 YadA-like family protein [Escherichia coli]EIH0174377.1 YadA-like family protein [Escherichia coli]EIW7010901.1 YadA-like family protein [Escherichia coli]EJA2687529.1 YadA-like family protein [Escherichia coli]
MNKKFSKTILSSAVAGLLLVSCGGLAAETKIIKGEYTIEYTGNDAAKIYKTGQSNKDENVLLVNTEKGSVSVANKKEISDAVKAIKSSKQYTELKKKFPGVSDDVVDQMIVQQAANIYKYAIKTPSLKLENLEKITGEEIEKIDSDVKKAKEVITSKTATAYNTAIENGVSVDSALAAAKDNNGALLNEFNRLGTNVNALKDATTFAIDENGEITDGQGVETVSVKSVVADVKADTTIYQNKDGSYTLDQSAPGNVRVNDAVVSLDNRTRSNTQAIQNHSRQLQEHNARLNSQQRQIRENHEEMKRAAAQSAALSGLFQPYSVGKFNATAALGGYSDKQAIAVGVGYRFNEQTAAKAGIAASDGDVSYNMGVNFEF